MTPRRAMSFVIGVILFVVVVGLLDRRVPWPRAPRGG
jgi:hypothetical protein